jgi:LacI family transcriptional regulator
MSTIKKVAKEAGVSTATVSRVLNGNYPVSKEAYERVMKAVKKTGYKGNAIAKSLKMNRTFLIGLVVPDISNSYFMEIAKRIEAIISSYGYTLTICSTNEVKEKEKEVLNLLNNKRLDAVVLATCHQDSSLIQEFIDGGMKIILFDSKLPIVKTTYVGEDNYGNTKKLLKHALDMGHKKIAIINGNLEMGTAVDRFMAYKDLLSSHGIVINPDYVLAGGFHSEIAYSAVLNLLNSEIENPSIIYATNNKMAEGALIALQEKGLKVPEDISLMSYGNISLPSLVKPPLTVIKHDTELLGEKIGQMLKQLLVDKSEAIEEVILDLDLVQGESVLALKK